MTYRRVEYDDVIDALCVADSFFHNCGTPIRLPFQMSFDGCLRIKHEKKEPSDESEAICAEPYSNQVPLSAITNNNSNSTCSKFLANYEYPQSKKNDRFDRRAVAGSVCSRHGVPIPKTFSNVYCGEAYLQNIH